MIYNTTSDNRSACNELLCPPSSMAMPSSEGRSPQIRSLTAVTAQTFSPMVSTPKLWRQIKAPIGLALAKHTINKQSSPRQTHPQTTLFRADDLPLRRLFPRTAASSRSAAAGPGHPLPLTLWSSARCLSMSPRAGPARFLTHGSSARPSRVPPRTPQRGPAGLPAVP